MALAAPASNLNSAPQNIDASAALRGVFSIFDVWGLSAPEGRTLLGDPSPATYFNWKKGKAPKSLPRDVLGRIGLIAGIWKALQILYSDHALADRWLRAENRAFAGKTPLAVLTGGDMAELIRVRQYLDAARGAWG